MFSRQSLNQSQLELQQTRVSHLLSSGGCDHDRATFVLYNKSGLPIVLQQQDDIMQT